MDVVSCFSRTPPPRANRRLRRPDTEQLTAGAYEDPSIRCRRGRDGALPKGVPADDLRRPARLDHHGVAVLADEIDVPTAGDGRRREDTVNALLPESGPGRGVKRRQHSDVVG